METLIGLLPDTAEGWTAAFTGGLLVTAVLTAWYARRQWNSSRKHHKEQVKAQAEAIRPYVLVTVETSKAAFNLFDLVIRNLGKRPAVEVEITLDPPPIRAREMQEPEIQMKNMKMLNEPMSLLAPEQEIRAFYDNHLDRKNRTDLPTVHTAKVKYKDMSGSTYVSEFTLDVIALKGMSQTTVGTTHEIYKALAKISKTINSAAVMQRNPDLTVHAVTESKAHHELRDLDDRAAWAKGSLKFSQQLTRGKHDGEYETDLLRRIHARRQELAAEPFIRVAQRMKYLSLHVVGIFGEYSSSLTTKLRSRKRGGSS